MSAVVHASVLVAALVDSGADGTWAEEIVARGALYAPELARVEAANILRRLETAGAITRANADAAFADLMEFALELYPFEPFAGRVWALRRAVTGYDGCYVALAEALQLPLATLDRRLARVKGLKCRVLLRD